MQERTIGRRGLVTSALGLGAWEMTGVYGAVDEREAIATVHRAIDLGVTLFDTADFYGPFNGERLLGRAVVEHRDQVVLSSKFGGVELDDDGRMIGGTNGRPEYVRRSAERSLRHLDTDRIDLYYQHRVDPDVPVEETFGALGELVAAGKVRHVGISEANAATIRRAHATTPLTAIQTEYSMFARDVEVNGVLTTARELGIGFVGYAPLARGFLTGAVRAVDTLAENDLRRFLPRFSTGSIEHNLELIRPVEKLATELGVSPAQLALAWVLAQGEDVVPIPGTRSPVHLEENVAAAALTLDAATVAALGRAVQAGAVAGRRFADIDSAIQQ